MNVNIWTMLLNIEMFATHEVIIARMLNCSEFSAHSRSFQGHRDGPYASKSGNQEAKSGKYWQYGPEFGESLPPRYRNSWHALRHMVPNKGVSSLYRGMSVVAWTSVPRWE